ncbi:MAG: hypothetical protein FJW44_09770 [Actinobacteria bacterium]|nr:hypothetical protein [Actinomycetota bacterium]
MDASDPRVHERRWLILAVLCLSLFLVVVDNLIVNGVLWNLCVTIPHPMGNSCASPNPSPTMPCHRLAGGPSAGPIHCAVTRTHRAQQVHPFAFRDGCEPSSTVSKTTGFLVATG